MVIFLGCRKFNGVLVLGLDGLRVIAGDVRSDLYLCSDMDNTIMWSFI